MICFENGMGIPIFFSPPLEPTLEMAFINSLFVEASSHLFWLLTKKKSSISSLFTSVLFRDWNRSRM